MFKLEFSTDNAAFELNGLEHEIEAVLYGVKQKIKCGLREGTAKDSNGNTVGRWSLTYEDKP